MSAAWLWSARLCGAVRHLEINVVEELRFVWDVGLIISDTILIMRLRRNLAIVEVVQTLRTSTSAQAPIDAHSLQRPWWYNVHCT